MNSRYDRLGFIAFAVGALFGAVCNSGCSITLPDIPDDPPIIKPEEVDPQPQATTDVAGIPCAGLPVVAKVGNLAISKSRISWSVAGIDNWGTKVVGDALCRGMTYLYVYRDGKWVGRGKFDWFRHGPPPQTAKGFENLHNGYYPNPPQRGERVAFGLVDVNNSKRSNFVEGVWP
jgi:hypothetical protein